MGLQQFSLGCRKRQCQAAHFYSPKIATELVSPSNITYTLLHIKAFLLLLNTHGQKKRILVSPTIPTNFGGKKSINYHSSPIGNTVKHLLSIGTCWKAASFKPN